MVILHHLRHSCATLKRYCNCLTSGIDFPITKDAEVKLFYRRSVGVGELFE